jgi:cofilin
MSRSGVVLSADCVPRFEELKLKKQFRYVVYKLNDARTAIVVEQVGDGDSKYEDFLETLPEEDCRYAVYDFEYQNTEGAPRSKICFYAWSPEGASVKTKMVYASSKDSIRRPLNGIGVEVQGTDFDEVSHESVLEKCLKGR